MIAGSPETCSRSMRYRRSGFTLAECSIALAVLAACSVMVAELATWLLAQESRIEARSEAEQAAANVLEQARALPWDELTPAWAADRKLPQGMLDRWPKSKLVVRVEAEPKHPRVKRVTAEVQWDGDQPAKDVPLRMTALFAARTGGGSQ